MMALDFYVLAINIIGHLFMRETFLVHPVLGAIQAGIAIR